MNRSSPVGRRRLADLRADLSERDLAVTSSVASLRYVSTRQLETLHFSEHATALSGARTCRRVLERLNKHRILTRLERRVGGVRAGSASFVYCLGPVGDRLVRAGETRRRSREPSFTYLDHTLAVGQVVVDLTLATRTGDIELEPPQVEPQCWRAFRTGVGGVQTLKPDLFLVLGDRDYEYRWFVEVDRGTEHLPAVLRKCRLYDAYYRTGQEEHRHGVSPKVIWSVPGAKRAERLTAAIDHERHLDTQLFSVVTADQVVQVLTGSVA